MTDASGGLSQCDLSDTYPACPDPADKEDAAGEEDTVAEEAASLWRSIGDNRPFPEAKYVQLLLNRYVFSRETREGIVSDAAARLERVALLLVEGRRIAPSDAVLRILKTYKRKMRQVGAAAAGAAVVDAHYRCHA
jgi:hypothetical protein